MDNREKILDCALTLFAERGYDAVGIQEIVETGGVTKPTLYHYFSSKHGLLETVLRKGFGELGEILTAAARYQGDLTLTLEQITRACFTYARQNPQFYRMHLSLFFAPQGSEANQTVRPYHAAQQAVMEEVFVQAVVQNGNLRGRQQQLAFTFLGVIHSYIGIYLQGSLQFSDELVYRIVHQYMHGVLS